MKIETTLLADVNQGSSLNTYWYDRLCDVMPGGVSSPVRACLKMGVTPPIVDYAKEDCFYDVDGNRYIDYCGSWGALIHGHAHPRILEAVAKRMAKGTSYGMTTPIEEQLARKIIQFIPSVEKIRFVSSGTEATMGALRLARGYTGKDVTIKFTGNYHGSSDLLLVKAGSGVTGLPESSSDGVPRDIVQHTISIPYNDSEACKAIFCHPLYAERIAAVIVEPIAGNMGTVPATLEFLETLRQETYRTGALLIFDEVITGFRVSLNGAQGLYGISPDLTCFGKIMGGGFPAAAFGGKREIMDCLAPLGKVYQGGTLSGNPVAMEAGLQALSMLEADGFYEELNQKTEAITKPVQELIQKKGINACFQQVGSMFTLFFGRRSVKNTEEAQLCDEKMYACFFRYMLSNGVYLPPLQFEAWFVSSAHSQHHLDKTGEIIRQFLIENY